MSGVEIQVLFVCTGNICRSPMAEALFRYRMRAHSECEAGSAGVAAPPGAPASDPAVEALSEWGIDLRDHRSRPVSAGLVEKADYILGMTQGHLQILQHHFPEAAKKCRLITSFGTDGTHRDIADPIGQTVHTYRHIRDELDGAISDFILYLMDQGTLHSPSTEGTTT